MNRAYSTFEIKSLDEEQRIIEGIATTPETDNIGDVVRSEGAQYRLPMPLLWQHNADQPIGHVTHAEVRRTGIKISAQIAKIANPGRLQDRLNEAWDTIKIGLVKGLSIGFSPLEYERLEGGKGIDFKQWRWLELSCVSIPANMSCNVQVIRAMDRKSLTASGKMATTVLLSGTRPGVSGVLKPQAKETSNMRTLSEQIESLENTRAAKAGRQTAVANAAIEEGRSTDTAEAEEIDALEAEIAAIDADLKRFRTIETRNAEGARPITNVRTSGNSNGNGVTINNGDGTFGTPLQPVTGLRSSGIRVVEPKLEQGIEFARYVMAVAAGRGNLNISTQIAADNWGPESDVTQVIRAMARIGTSGNLEIIDRFQQMAKANVGTGVSVDDNWAGPLVFAYPRFAGDFIEYLRPRTILGNISGLRRIPFNVNIAGQTTGANAYWVGEGKPKPLTQFSFTSVNFRWAKIATISVLSNEMVRFSNPSAEQLVRDELTRSIAERMDLDFIDPAKAAVVNVSPASITNGITPHHSAGNTGDLIRGDIETLMQGFDDVDINLTDPVFIMSSTKARQLSLMRNALGQKEFPDTTLMGGSLEGIPIVASRYVSRFGTTGGEYVLLINASDIFYADDGQVTINASQEASLEMLDGSLLQDASGGTGASLVSMFQTNSTAILCERYVNWQRRRNAAVQVLDMCFWGGQHTSGT